MRILHLCATTKESRVEEALVSLMERSELTGYTAVRAAARDEVPEVPSCQIAEVDLSVYDLWLEGEAA